MTPYRQCLTLVLLAACIAAPVRSEDAERVSFNHPGLTVGLGAGLWAWPLPIDYDHDGDIDLIVTCPDVPSNGVYYYENPGGDQTLPVFKPAVRLSGGMSNISISTVGGKPRVLVPGFELTGAAQGDFRTRQKIYPTTNVNKDSNVRANQWKYVDYDGDGAVDLIVGVESWKEYGWDNAFNEKGEWTRGPLHGWVYLLRNTATTDKPEYAAPVRLKAGDEEIDVFGMPSPNLEDFDGDGDLDLLCGDFVGGLTYFANVGTRTEPRFAPGRTLTTAAGHPLVITQPMIVPVAADFDRDGDVDLLVGQEDGHVAFVEHTGKAVDQAPVFAEPRLVQQQADALKFGALVTPVSVDWDGDGDEDIIAGNAAGYIGFIENLDGGNPPKWAAPQRLQADGKTIRIMAGYNGSIQGPAEKMWGYTTLSVADWDHDGLLDILVNSIWGKIEWYRNVGSAKAPRLAAAQPVRVQWEGAPPKPAWNWWNPESGTLATQWRTTPVAMDLTGDGLCDLVMLDHEGYLALFERKRQGDQLVLLPGRRALVDPAGKPLQLNGGAVGRSGRRKLCFVDLDRDGMLDLLANSRNATWYKQVPIDNTDQPRRWAFAAMGDVTSRKLAGHTSSPTTVDWNHDGVREVLIGAEDGRFYHVANPRLASDPIVMSDLTITGRGFEMAKLTDGSQAFSNRDYVWHDVPGQLDGWQFTRINGGGFASIQVEVKRKATLLAATSYRQTKFSPPGWEQVDGLSFGYNDSGRTRLQVYRREAEAGDKIEIPQGNWTGCLLLVKPDASKGAGD